MAQGTLQSLFEFQTQVALLTGMEVANASLYDGATACAEAVAMAHRVTRRGKAILSGGLHPHYAKSARPTRSFPGRGRRAEADPGMADPIDIDSENRPASSCSTPISSASCAIARTGGALPPGGGAADRRGYRDRVPGRGEVAREIGADIVAPRRSVAGQRAQLSAARMSASSRRASSMCGRCRGGSSARPPTPTAGAAGC